jgi:peptidoglycan hydrolase-like protein with peptidoglycan-binding domain
MSPNTTPSAPIVSASVAGRRAASIGAAGYRHAVANPVRVRRFLLLVLALAAVPAPAAAASGRVAALQVALRAVGLYAGTVDGTDGPGTRAAVRAFQARHGLAVDGIAGPATRRALGRRGRPAWGSRALHAGERGWDVAVLQFLLAREGFPSGTVDGGFGAHLDAALRRFQRWAGVPPDGVAGPATRRALRGPRPATPLRFAWPVRAAVGDRFGPRGARFHSGVDFPVATGTPIAAAGRGCVAFAGYDAGGYGNLVVIRHRLGVTTWYAHLSRISVSAGQCVVAGVRVGLAGATGDATGPHLHFEVRVRGAVIDPLSVL